MGPIGEILWATRIIDFARSYKIQNRNRYLTTENYILTVKLFYRLIRIFNSHFTGEK